VQSPRLMVGSPTGLWFTLTELSPPSRRVSRVGVLVMSKPWPDTGPVALTMLKLGFSVCRMLNCSGRSTGWCTGGGVTMKCGVTAGVGVTYGVVSGAGVTGGVVPANAAGAPRPTRARAPEAAAATATERKLNILY